MQTPAGWIKRLLGQWHADGHVCRVVSKRKIAESGRGVLCASIGEIVGGDAAYVTSPLNGMPAPPFRRGESREGSGYLSDVDPKDQLAYPINSPSLVAKFPPALLVTSTRAMEFGAAINSHNALVKYGVEAELHVWDGLPHAFWYNSELPESREVYDAIAKFFDLHLRHRGDWSEIPKLAAKKQG